jgi:hypothetical protein
MIEIDRRADEFLAELKSLFDKYEIEVVSWGSYDNEENCCGDNYAIRSKRLDYDIDINIDELVDDYH